MISSLRKRSSIFLGVALLLFGGVTISSAQTADSDSAEVGLEVVWECPVLRTPEAQSDSTLMSGVAMFVQAAEEAPPLTGSGNCPTVVPQPTTTAGCPDRDTTAHGSSGMMMSFINVAAPSGAYAVTGPLPGGCPHPGGGPTVPVVMQLPDTGVAATSQSATSIVLVATLLAGSVLALGALAGSRKSRQ